MERFGTTGGRDAHAGGHREFGRGRFRFDTGTSAYGVGGDRLGVSQLGNAAGVYDLAAGRGDQRGAIQLEVILGIHHRTVGRSPQLGSIQSDITGIYDLTVTRSDQPGTAQLEVTTSTYARAANHRARPRATHLNTSANTRHRHASCNLTRRTTRSGTSANTLDRTAHPRLSQREVTPTRSHFTAQPLNRRPQLKVPIYRLVRSEGPGIIATGATTRTLNPSPTRRRSPRCSPRHPLFRHPLRPPAHGPPVPARATPNSPDSTRSVRQGAGVGQWRGWEEVGVGDEVVSGDGVRRSPGVMASGAVDQDVSAIGGVALRGRIRGT